MQLSQKLTELEKKFPARIRLKYQNKGKLCFHKNIAWNGCFNKQGKNDEPYCLDCGEDGEFGVIDEFELVNFREMSNYIEEYCLEFAGEQKSNIPNKDDIEREKLKRTIKKLERKPNKSPEEETELKNLKGKLKDLEKNNNSSPFNYTP
ncbi:6813_t:CDS:2 [Funneliformis geosporum]|uniref:6813_t:CDS:1 n=1 Tax=Funneliformis geosporum TaxID=1117311 RepID=A0A9W4SAF3_9GLOM|nr:6813_t:CDS:2 [Funneliformis geosporum]